MTDVPNFISTEHFKSPVWTIMAPEFLLSLNKASNPYIKKARKKASLMWGQVMGNLIFKPNSLKMQPPICSAIRYQKRHYG